MLVNRSPARKRGISGASITSEALGAIRMFTDGDVESTSGGGSGGHGGWSDQSADPASLPPPLPLPPLVNYHRHRNTANVLRRVMAYQFLAGRFCMDLDPDLRSCLEQLQCLDNPTVHALSREREPPVPRRRSHSFSIDH